MTKSPKLAKTMSEAEFINGYWYATELKTFARSIGITSANQLRKDELEPLILEYLRNKLPIPTGYASWKKYQQSNQTGN
jgi:hypothetical protein